MSIDGSSEPLIQRRSDEPGVNVLIVSVGRYALGEDLALPGARASARRLATWWMNAAAEHRLLDGQSLASLDIVVSSERPLFLSGDDGNPKPVRSATAATVREALRAWCKRNVPGSTAVLHWIGHGEIQGEGGRAPVHALYCEDMADSEGRRFRDGIDWAATLEGIAAHTSDAKLVASIDTCRVDAPQGFSFTYENPFGSHSRGAAKRQQRVVYYSALGRRNYCLDPHEDACEDFSDGGAIMSEAMLLALDRFGAIYQSDQYGPAAYVEHVRLGTQARLERWAGRVPALDGLNPTVVCEPNNWPWKEPIVKVPKPMSMVDVSLDHHAPTGTARCRIIRPSGLPAPHQGVLNWQFDGNRCEHEVEAQIPGDGSHAKKESNVVLCAQPHHELILRQT